MKTGKVPSPSPGATSTEVPASVVMDSIGVAVEQAPSPPSHEAIPEAAPVHTTPLAERVVERTVTDEERETYFKNILEATPKTLEYETLIKKFIEDKGMHKDFVNKLADCLARKYENYVKIFLNFLKDVISANEASKGYWQMLLAECHDDWGGNIFHVGLQAYGDYGERLEEVLFLLFQEEIYGFRRFGSQQACKSYMPTSIGHTPASFCFTYFSGGFHVFEVLFKNEGSHQLKYYLEGLRSEKLVEVRKVDYLVGCLQLLLTCVGSNAEFDDALFTHFTRVLERLILNIIDTSAEERKGELIAQFSKLIETFINGFEGKLEISSKSHNSATRILHHFTKFKGIGFLLGFKNEKGITLIDLLLEKGAFPIYEWTNPETKKIEIKSILNESNLWKYCNRVDLIVEKFLIFSALVPPTFVRQIVGGLARSPSSIKLENLRAILQHSLFSLSAGKSENSIKFSEEEVIAQKYDFWRNLFIEEDEKFFLDLLNQDDLRTFLNMKILPLGRKSESAVPVRSLLAARCQIKLSLRANVYLFHYCTDKGSFFKDIEDLTNEHLIMIMRACYGIGKEYTPIHLSEEDSYQTMIDLLKFSLKRFIWGSKELNGFLKELRYEIKFFEDMPETWREKLMKHSFETINSSGEKEVRTLSSIL